MGSLRAKIRKAASLERAKAQARAMTEKAIVGGQDKAVKIAMKPLTSMIKNAKLEKQIQIANWAIDQIGVDSFQIQFISDDGLPADIRDFKKKGMSNQEIKDMYWLCPGFKEFWARINCEEVLLDAMIENA